MNQSILNLHWHLLLDRIIHPGSAFWSGLAITVGVAIASQLLGTLLGGIAALCRASRLRVLRILAGIYVYVMRGTPVIVLIFFVYYGTNLLFGVNLFPREVGLASVTVPGAILAGVAALGIQEGAYMCEIIRASLETFDRGQVEAAKAVGMTPWKIGRHVVAPQAIRIILPPFGNDFNNVIKNTSLLSFIGVADIFLNAEEAYAATFRPVEVFFGVLVWYLIITSAWNLIQRRLEWRLGISDRGRSSTGPRRASAGSRRRRLVWRATAVRSLTTKCTLATAPSKSVDGSGDRREASASVSANSVHLLAEREINGGLATAQVVAPIVGQHCDNMDLRAPLLSARGVSKSFGGTPILQDVDLDVWSGDVVCIIGPSGAGKTTFLRSINHLEPIDKGMITVAGKSVGYRLSESGGLYENSAKVIATRRAEVGFVFQHFNLWRHLTALDNVRLPLIQVRGLDQKEAMEVATSALKRVGLLPHAEAYPASLSGGQQQRVAIARAVAMDPALMLFDEPTSALDPEMVGEVLDVVKELVNGGMTMIIVTHEIGFARSVGSRVVVMDEGRVIEEGNPLSLLSAPTMLRTQEFLARVLEH